MNSVETTMSKVHAEPVQMQMQMQTNPVQMHLHAEIDQAIKMLNNIPALKDGKPFFKPDTLVVRDYFTVLICVHDTDDKEEFTRSMDKLLEFVESYQKYEFVLMGDWNNSGEQSTPYSFQFYQKGKSDVIIYSRSMNRKLKLTFPKSFTSAKGRLYTSQFNKVLKIDQNCIDGMLYFPIKEDIFSLVSSLVFYYVISLFSLFSKIFMRIYMRIYMRNIQTNAIILDTPHDNKLIPSNWCADHTAIETRINGLTWLSLNLCGESGTGGFNWAEFMTPEFSTSVISNPEIKKRIKNIISQFTTEERIKNKWYSKRTRHLQELNIHRPPLLCPEWEVYPFYNRLLVKMTEARQTDLEYPESKLTFPKEEVIEARDTILRIFNAIFEDKLIKPLLVEWFDYILKNPKMSWKEVMCFYLESGKYDYLFFQEVDEQMAKEMTVMRNEIVNMGYCMHMKETDTKTRGVIFVRI
jgi:hypothetical protein